MFEIEYWLRVGEGDWSFAAGEFPDAIRSYEIAACVWHLPHHVKANLSHIASKFYENEFQLDYEGMIALGDMLSGFQTGVVEPTFMQGYSVYNMVGSLPSDREDWMEHLEDYMPLDRFNR